MSLPLAGRRVLVTRAVHQASRLSDGLAALGAEPVAVPVLEFLPPEDCMPFDAAIRELAAFDWLILTSTNTVVAFQLACARVGVDAAALPSLKVAVIGEATAKAALNAGLRVALVPERQDSEGFVEAVGSLMDGARVLYPRAAVARDVIPEWLRGRAELTAVEAYRTVLPEAAHAVFMEVYAEGFDAACFASSSAVRHLARLAEMAGVSFPLTEVAAVSIGPATSATLRELGWEPAAEAEVSDLAGLVEAVVRVLGR